MHRVSSLVGWLSLIKVGTVLGLWMHVGGASPLSARLLPLSAGIENGQLAGVDGVNRYALALYGDLPVLVVLGVVEVELGRSDHRRRLLRVVLIRRPDLQAPSRIRPSCSTKSRKSLTFSVARGRS